MDDVGSDVPLSGEILMGNQNSDAGHGVRTNVDDTDQLVMASQIQPFEVAHETDVRGSFRAGHRQQPVQSLPSQRDVQPGALSSDVQLSEEFGTSQELDAAVGHLAVCHEATYDPQQNESAAFAGQSQGGGDSFQPDGSFHPDGLGDTPSLTVKGVLMTDVTEEVPAMQADLTSGPGLSTGVSLGQICRPNDSCTEQEVAASSSIEMSPQPGHSSVRCVQSNATLLFSSSGMTSVIESDNCQLQSLTPDSWSPISAQEISVNNSMVHVQNPTDLVSAHALPAVPSSDLTKAGEGIVQRHVDDDASLSYLASLKAQPWSAAKDGHLSAALSPKVGLAQTGSELQGKLKSKSFTGLMKMLGSVPALPASAAECSTNVGAGRLWMEGKAAAAGFGSIHVTATSSQVTAVTFSCSCSSGEDLQVALASCFSHGNGDVVYSRRAAAGAWNSVKFPHECSEDWKRVTKMVEDPQSSTCTCGSPEAREGCKSPLGGPRKGVKGATSGFVFVFLLGAVSALCWFLMLRGLWRLGRQMCLATLE